MFSAPNGPFRKLAPGGFGSGGSWLNYSFQEVAFVSFDHTESGKGRVRISGTRGGDKKTTYFKFPILCHVPWRLLEVSVLTFLEFSISFECYYTLSRGA